VNYSAAAGYEFRPASDFMGAHVGPEIVLQAATAVVIAFPRTWLLGAQLEAYSDPAVGTSTRRASPAEALGGFTAQWKGLGLGAMGGLGLSDAPGVPNTRMLLRLSYSVFDVDPSGNAYDPVNDPVAKIP